MARLKGLGRGLDALLSNSDEAREGDALRSLADSIRNQGVMQPILVRPVDAGRYEIIAGERRWLAAQRAGLAEIPALVRVVPDQAALALALIENIQREDLNPLEEAQGIKRLIDEFGLTHEAAAQAGLAAADWSRRCARRNGWCKPPSARTNRGARRHGAA